MDQEDPLIQQIRHSLREFRPIVYRLRKTEYLRVAERRRGRPFREDEFSFHQNVIGAVYKKLKEMPEEERKKTMEKIRNWMILMKNYLESDLEQLEKSRMRYERVEEPRDRVNVINPLKRGRPGYIVEEERCKEVKRMLRRMRAGELLPIEMVHHHYNLATLKGERLVEEINARKAQGIEEEIEEPEEWNVDDELEEYSVIGPRVEQEIDDFLMGHDHPSFLIPGAADFIFPKFCIEKIKRKWWRMPQSRTLYLPRSGNMDWATWNKRDIEEWVEKFIEDEDNLQLIIEKQFNGQSLSEFLNNEGHGMPLGIFIQLKSNFNRVVNEFNGFKYEESD